MNNIILSKSINPYFNLALEEYMLDNIAENQTIMYLWQNDNTVVIGNNQNPWKECDIAKINSENVKLARRLSGGGAVFHDMGNLNFTFLTKRNNYSVEKQLKVISNALLEFGLIAVVSGRNDITINDKKFSGNAFYYTGNNYYHHGTLLVDAKLSRLATFLTPSKQKIMSKGITSVRSRVINLKTLNDEITIDKIIENLKISFENLYGKVENTKIIDENSYAECEKFAKMNDKYSSWQWIYGDSPNFDAEFSNRYNWGEVSIGIKINDGVITSAKVYTDSLNTHFIDKLELALNKVVFTKFDIANAINMITKKDDNEITIFNDIITLFAELD
ncbi:MAG: lipoate--protein ligase [Clostridia bacterium]